VFSGTGASSGYKGTAVGTSPTSCIALLPFRVTSRIPVTGITVSSQTMLNVKEINGNTRSSTSMEGSGFGNDSLALDIETAAGLTANRTSFISFNTTGRIICTGAEL
jgi:hypothetical protein